MPPVAVPKAKSLEDFMHGMQHGLHGGPALPSLRGSLGSIGRITDINRTGTCKDDLDKHCSGVAPGNGRLAHCLHQTNKAAKARKEKMQTTAACTTEVANFFHAAAKNEGPASVLPGRSPTVASALRNMSRTKLFNIDPVEGFQAACRDDAKSLCPQAHIGTPLMLCLKFKKSQLSEPCRNRVFQVQKHESEDWMMDIPLKTACEEDILRIPACKRRGPAGSHKACLQAHRTELSEKCRAGLFGREQEDAEDIRLNVDLFTACKAEVSAVCSDKTFGEARILRCLWEHTVNPRQGTFSEACKTKVRATVGHSLADYRLDFRVRSRCKTDIDRLCAEERDRVDKLSISELFGSHQAEHQNPLGGGFEAGASGEVLRCLKSKMGELSGTSGCKSEIMHVVKVQAVQPKADPMLARHCKSDIARYCPAVKQEQLHLCLRKSLGKLEESCKKVEILQGSLEAKAVTLKPLLLNACKSAVSMFCKDVPVGEAQVLECLHDHMEEVTFPARCKDYVEHDLEANNHDYRLKYGISEHCKADMSTLCKDEMVEGGGKVLMCLRDNVAKVKDTACKSSVIRFARQGASNIMLAPKVYNACITDVQTFCADVPPGAGRVHACLMEHKEKLSASCARAEFKTQVVMGTDIRTDPKAMAACGPAIKKLCADVQMGNGRVWKCLQDAKPGAEEMSEACAAVVKSHTRLQHSEFHMNPGMSAFCEPEAKKLCSVEMEKANRKDFLSHGSVITCLLENLEKVENPACKASLRRKAGQRVSEVQNDPAAKSACEGDVQKFCQEAKQHGGAGNVQMCLQAKLAQLSMPCRSKQKFYMAMASKDIRTNPEMAKACAAAQKRFCEEVGKGEGRMIYCLLDHMHHPEMEASCREKLLAETEKRAKSISFNPGVMKNCKKDLEAFKSQGLCTTHFPFTGDDGKELDCLTTNIDKVTEPMCNKSLTDVLRLQSADIRAKPGMQAACKQDIDTLCPGVSPGGARLQSCLRNHLKEIKDPECKVMVNEVIRHDKSSFKVNFMVRTHCKKERQTFCREATPAQSQVMECLALHVNETGFGVDCQKALDGSHVKSTLLKDKVAVQLENLQRYIMKNRGVIEKWGGVLLGCVVAVVALLAFGISYWVLQQRFKKVGYTVEVPSAMD